jgi:hypothetical protein
LLGSVDRPVSSRLGEPSGVPSTIDGVQREAVPVQPSMLWPDHDNQALKPAERQLLDAVASGALDAHLVAIADAVQARRALLDTVRSANVVAELCLGDTVMFNREIRPRYLQHEIATVLELEDHWVTVRLWRPVGRFEQEALRCPPLALKKVDRALDQPGA